MKRTTMFGILGALALLSPSRALFAQPGPVEHAPTAPAHGRSPAGMLDGLIKKYDVNRDGQLDATELAAMRQAVDGEGFVPHGPGGPRGSGRGSAHLPKEIIEQYDGDKDGKLSDEERAVLHQDIKDGKVTPPTPPRPPRPEGPPHATTTSQVLEKFDANKDGVLDESELASFLSQARPHRPPGPPHAPAAPEPPPEHQ